MSRVSVVLGRVYDALRAEVKVVSPSAVVGDVAKVITALSAPSSFETKVGGGAVLDFAYNPTTTEASIVLKAPDGTVVATLTDNLGASLKLAGLAPTGAAFVAKIEAMVVAAIGDAVLAAPVVEAVVAHSGQILAALAAL